eukprot:TRINITY_DN9262_c0_g3_i1.p1 TRINITY_DN9262_c0_g3~~TRINITY_DN9262_c0_g3_i1.p1  ORF type:complete len:168 (+),score=32.45 TRINITY_DN9262_c0_g3_i1:218-721(+)
MAEAEAKRSKPDDTDLPEGWIVKQSRSDPSKWYYFAPLTKQSSWEKPTKPVKDCQAEQVRAAHILAKHVESRRPSSWRQEVITRSKQEARDIITKHRADVLNGRKEFQDIAKTESDCSSAKRGGDLGFFKKGQMQKAFEEVAFALEVNEVSGLVESDSGVHIIKRLG